MEITYKSVIADNGVQFFLPCDVEEIGRMTNDSFINENKSLERRYTDQEVADSFDISSSELDRIKKEYGVPSWL